MDKEKVSIFWFRRDLRLHDNAGLYHALKDKVPVLPLFIFDKDILDRLEDKKDRRVHFIYLAVQKLKESVEKSGGSMLVKYGKPVEVITKLLTEYEISAIYTNHDYEPYAKERDNNIGSLLKQNSIPFLTYKDQVIFEKDEVLKDDKSPYTVYTPYSKKWKALLNEFYIKPYPTEKYFGNFYKLAPKQMPSLQDMDFFETDASFPSMDLVEETIANYKEMRDFPAMKGTSRLSVHLRFGTVSIRHLVAKARGLSETWLNELIWREFYMMILWHFPHVVNSAFKPEYNKIKWRNNEREFEAWCKGETGYPLIDAGMRELNETGFMHNRVRMIAASFLIKDLLIDWRWGEAYFAKKLLDFDLASNNGGWQWVAGSGCDGSPYFRIFNPDMQTEKFDKNLEYVKKWVPEFSTLEYIQKKIVDHYFARDRTLEAFKVALEK